MKAISKLYTVAALGLTLGFTSCIEEVVPETNRASSDQIETNKSALSSAANGIPTQMCQGYLIYGSQTDERDMAYPALMIAQSELLGDMYPGGGNIGYDWYVSFNTPNRSSVGPTSMNAFIPWYTLYKFVKSANDIIKLTDVEEPTTEQQGYAGMAYTARAFDYFMLMSFYEPIKNIYTDVSKVEGLTIPIVTEKTTADDAKNNARVTHDKMVEFILSDLDKAESLLQEYDPSLSNQMLPGLAVAYGIKAKVYMWDENYAKAAEYARLAIAEAEQDFESTPMSESEWTDPSTGFAKACSSWMWYTHYSPENMGNLCNFVGWISGEAQWGYSSLTQPVIDRKLYDKIGENDFRKHVFVDPQRSNYYKYKSSIGSWYIDSDYVTDYQALKFRCLNGDYNNYSIGGATDVPIMRIEEMYFIEAIATGMQDGKLEEGKALLNSFMKAYRNTDYSCEATTARDFMLEALDQMRIEFWGEGNAFPLAKRFKVGVMQNYEGVNELPGDAQGLLKINCKGIKPSWNFVIPTDEVESNVALDGMNNPDPTNSVSYPSEEGVYSPGKYAE